jgi:hypothetical protein
LKRCPFFFREEGKYITYSLQDAKLPWTVWDSSP